MAFTWTLLFAGGMNCVVGYMNATWLLTSSGSEYASVRTWVVFVASCTYVVKLAFRSVFACSAGIWISTMSPDADVVVGVMPFLLSHVLTAFELSAEGATSCSTYYRAV